MKSTAQLDRDVNAKNDDAHRVFDLVVGWIFPIDIILDLDNEIAVIPRVRFTRKVALDFFALLGTN